MFSTKLMIRAIIVLFLSAIYSPLVSAQAVSVNAADFYDVHSPTAGIQDAVDALPAAGGIVYIPAGTYAIIRSITLRSGVRIYGEGGQTKIIRRDPYLQVLLSAPAKEGDIKAEQILGTVYSFNKLINIAKETKGHIKGA